MSKISLIKIFGSLPVHPSVFTEKLSPRDKWTSEIEEGDNFCVSCGTLTPDVPKSHHKECGSYLDADDYVIHKNELGDCPKCKSEDGLNIDSSWELQESVISCCDCDFVFCDHLPEDQLIEKYKLKPVEIVER